MRRKERTDSTMLSPDLHIYAMSHVPPPHHHTTAHRDAHAHTCVCMWFSMLLERLTKNLLSFHAFYEIIITLLK